MTNIKIKQFPQAEEFCRDWCFTDHSMELLWPSIDLWDVGYDYLVIGHEQCPTTGNYHFQGFIQMKEPQGLFTMKEHFHDQTIHWEPRRGTATQAADYCKKENMVLELGTLQSRARQGTRSDIIALTNDIREGKDETYIMFFHPALYMRYANNIKRMICGAQSSHQKEWRILTVDVYCGKSGAGKSKLVRELYPDLYLVNTRNKTEFLFNGYQGEKVILFDDFYGEVPYTYMLQICDGYKLPLNIKNGDTCAMWDTVIFTSNKTPKLWWQSGLKNMTRRIDHCWEVSGGNPNPTQFSIKLEKKWEDNL